MKRIAITGNIGSGKTWVSQLFTQKLQIPVFDSDEATKNLYDRPDVRQQMQARFGEDLYIEAGLDRRRLAELIFADREAMHFVEEVAYPPLFEVFENWIAAHGTNKPYVLFESAIVFEKHLEQHFDGVIMVTASEETRLRRVMIRNHCNEAEVRQRMVLQWTDEQKCALADFVVHHDRDEEDAYLLRQIRRIHRTLSS